MFSQVMSQHSQMHITLVCASSRILHKLHTAAEEALFMSQTELA